MNTKGTDNQNDGRPDDVIRGPGDVVQAMFAAGIQAVNVPLPAGGHVVVHKQPPACARGQPPEGVPFVCFVPLGEGENE